VQRAHSFYCSLQFVIHFSPSYFLIKGAASHLSTGCPTESLKQLVRTRVLLHWCTSWSLTFWCTHRLCDCSHVWVFEAMRAVHMPVYSYVQNLVAVTAYLW